MADVKPLKLVDHGDGAGRLEEFGAADKVPAENLPATEWTAETVAQAEAEAGTAQTRRAWTSQRVRQAIAAWWNGSDAKTQLDAASSGITSLQASKQAAHANLSALSGLTGAADRLPYFTGADALSLTTLTGLARNLLDDTTQSGMQSTLGLGTASTRTALGTTGALYSRDSILGTVSQSGGVPTGAIIERGSNANGEYTKYADGTLECWHLLAMDHAAGTDLVTIWDLPSWIATTSGSLTLMNVRSPGSTNSYITEKLEGVAVNGTTVQLRTQFSVAQFYVVAVYLKGRWY